MAGCDQSAAGGDVDGSSELEQILIMLVAGAEKNRNGQA
jgi:hypothetical protein